MTGHFRRRSWTRPSRNISRHTKCSQAKNWTENNSSSEIEHTLQTAPDAHSEAVSFYIKCDKNKTVARKQRGIYNKYRNQKILTDQRSVIMSRKDKAKKKKTAGDYVLTLVLIVAVVVQKAEKSMNYYR